MDGESAQTSVAGEPKRRMFVEHLAVQVHANVGLHVFGTVVEHLARVYTLGDGPGAYHVVHDALLQLLGHVVKLHELANVVEHFVVASRGRIHLREDCGHVTENGCV